MKAKVEIELCDAMKSKDKNEILRASKALTCDADSVQIQAIDADLGIVTVTFTMPNTRQSDAVDLICSRFKFSVSNYWTCTISFA